MQQRRIALRFRQEELPFVLINVPEVEAAPSELFSLENLKDQFGHEPRQVDPPPTPPLLPSSYLPLVPTLLSTPPPPCYLLISILSTYLPFNTGGTIHRQEPLHVLHPSTQVGQP